MDQAVVERQREPVALEVRARPRQFFDWVWAYYLNPPWLRIPGFWEREFGITSLASRDYYPYASLNSITPDDLRSFYDTYYVPALMTLTVIGDVPRSEVLDKAASTFATLPVRPDPPAEEELRDPSRYRQTVFWAYRSNVYLSYRFKFYGTDAQEDETLIFISRLLDRRLNERLRFGERKATYGLRVGVVRRGAASYLQISGGVKTDELEFARGVVESELAALRDGAFPEETFEADRAAVIQQLQVASASAEGLEGWVRNFFYDTRVHEDFPDLAASFDSLAISDLHEFARRHFVPERQLLTLIRPFPINQGLAVVLVLTLVWLTIRLARRWLTRPLEMPKIRYTAHFKLPFLYRLTSLALLVIAVAVVGRLLVYGFQFVSDRVLVTIDHFAFQWTAYGLMLALAVLLFILLLARVPSKLIVLEDELRVKYLSYRSRRIAAEQLEAVTLANFREVWLSRRLWRCLPLTVGLLAPGIYLRQKNGGAYFFDVRDRDELLGVLTRLQAQAQQARG